jgi:hypothetical protein
MSVRRIWDNDLTRSVALGFGHTRRSCQYARIGCDDTKYASHVPTSSRLEKAHFHPPGIFATANACPRSRTDSPCFNETGWKPSSQLQQSPQKRHCTAVSAAAPRRANIDRPFEDPDQILIVSFGSVFTLIRQSTQFVWKGAHVVLKQISDVWFTASTIFADAGQFESNLGQCIF